MFTFGLTFAGYPAQQRPEPQTLGRSSSSEAGCTRNGRMPLVSRTRCAALPISPASSPKSICRELHLAAGGVPNGSFQTLSNGNDTALGIRINEFNFFFQDED